MIEKFFKVTLLSDVVLNSKLATEGNMETLNYVPGSNFLGIVAAKLYSNLKENNLTDEDAYNIFHSDKVSFGDATISKNDEISYPTPFDYMMVKGEEKLGEHQVYLQYLLTDLKKDKLPKDKENKYRTQLKQKRSGFITPSGKAITKIKNNFALKSAQDAGKRRSKDGAMFGFESLQKGQEFIFSVQFESEEYINIVTNALKGRKRVGKSKTAQYGQVKIEPLSNDLPKIGTCNAEEYTLVYAQSNLCFYDEFGQPTFQPTAEDLGLEGGKVIWGKSQVRTYEYSPWNGKRNTTDTLRACIAAGSIFYVAGKNEGGFKQVGAHQAEGLGRIVINPVFLKGNKEDGKCDFELNEIQESNAKKSTRCPEEVSDLNLNTPLGEFLQNKYEEKQEAINLSKSIQEQFEWAKSGKFYNVTSSQWGAIRAYATKANDFNDLRNSLLEGDNAYLRHGVAYDRIWSKRQNLTHFKKIFNGQENNKRPTVFIEKFAAEMAKFEQRKKNV